MIRILLNDNEFIEEYISWDEIKSVLSRSEMHGVIITQSLDIRLIQSAYDYIDGLDNSDDIAAECTCVIQSHTSINGWSDEFNGYLDFTSLKRDNKEATKTITISAFSDNFANKFLERLDVEVPYDRLIGLDDNVITPNTNEYYNVSMEGIEAIDKTTINITGTENWNSNTLYPSMYSISQGGGWLSPTNEDAAGQVSDVAPSETFINDRTFFAPTNFTGNISGTLDISIKNTGQANNTFWLLDFKTLTGITLEKVQTNLTGVDGLREVSIDFNYDFDTSTRLALYIGSNTQIEDIYATESNIKVISKGTETPCNLVPPLEWGERILEQITGQSNPLYAPFFGRTDRGYDEDGKGSLLFATNGKLVRQFPTGYTTDDSEKKAQLGASFKSYFENYNKIYSLGAGVIYEDGQYKLYIDDRENFYLNELVYNFTNLEAKSFSKEKLLELYYSEIEVGSVYEAPEEVSGLEEYLARQKYSTPILNENKLDLVTDFITTAYPFEFARRKPYTGTETEDYKYDNNVMLFKVYRDGGFVQHSAQDFEEITGLENVTSYINLDITPQRILKYNYGWWINTGLRGYQDKYLKYNKSEIITDLGTLKVGEIAATVENSDIQISTLSTAKFTGNVVMFNAAISANTFKLARNNPYGLYGYPDPLTGETSYGYLKELSTSPIDKKTNVELWETTGFVEGEAYRLLEDGSYRLLETGAIRLLEE